MPAGRKPNHDKKIARLVNDLRKALVAREQELIEAHVTKHVDALVATFHRVGAVVGDAVGDTVVLAKAAPAEALASVKRVKRKAWSPAARAAAKARMAAWWAKRRGKAKAAKEDLGATHGTKKMKAVKAPAAKKTARPKAASKGRARQIAAMKAYWAKKRAAKATAPAPAAPVPAK